MRYAVGIILIIIFAVVAIIFFSRGTSSNTRSSAAASRFTKLAEYDDKESASVSWTMQGRIVGEGEFRSVRITLTRSARTIEILDGYKQITERKQEYNSTPEAFQTFARALDLASFGKERTVKQADERGTCPLGNRFIYRLTESGREVMRTWSTTCFNTDGPFSGNPTLISQLFKNQIPDYLKFTSNVQF